MLKKNKKKVNERDDNVLYNMDIVLDANYAQMMDEIEMYQAEIRRADRKSKKKMQKKFNGKGFYPYEYQLNAREHVVQEMVDANFLDRCMKLFQEIVPIVKIIARLVAALILSILSVTQVNGRISKETLSKLSAVYNLAMSVG